MKINLQKRSIFVNGTIIAAVCVAVIFFSGSLISIKENFVVDIILDSLGIFFLLFGICLRSSARGHKHEKLSQEAAIVTDGPYKLTQNPMYLGSFLVGFGVVMIVLKWWVIPIYTALYLLWYWHQIYNERKVLLRKYGQAYLDYSSAIPLFFPKLKTMLRLRSAKIMPVKKIWLKGETAIIVVWTMVVLAAEFYEGFTARNLAGSVIEAIVLIAATISAGAFLFFCTGCHKNVSNTLN